MPVVILLRFLQSFFSGGQKSFDRCPIGGIGGHGKTDMELVSQNGVKTVHGAERTILIGFTHQYGDHMIVRGDDIAFSDQLIYGRIQFLVVSR